MLLTQSCLETMLAICPRDIYPSSLEYSSLVSLVSLELGSNNYATMERFPKTLSISRCPSDFHNVTNCHLGEIGKLCLDVTPETTFPCRVFA